MISLRHRIAFISLLALSSIAISATVYIAHPSIQHYRGLSGIDSALFIYFGLDFISTSWKSGERKIAFAGAFLILILAGKTAFEVVSGSCLFVVSDSFVPLVAAHVAGIIAGMIVFSAGAIYKLPKTCQAREGAINLKKEPSFPDCDSKWNS